MRGRLRDLALFALPTLIDAVSLADMTPRATGLPPQCNAVYTSQIWGCSPSDFQTQQCSSSCINALYGLAAAIDHACSNQGVEGQNLVVAFLAGVGPQQLCHNAGSGPEETTKSMQPSTKAQHQQSTSAKVSIISSTTTARKPTDTESSLLVDTSSTMTQTMIPHRTTHKTQKAQHTTQTSSTASSTQKVVVTKKPSPSPSPSPSTESTQTTSAAGSKKTSIEDQSGGGSPFDTTTNSASAYGITLPLMLPAIAALIAAFR